MNRIFSFVVASSVSIGIAFGADVLPFKERQRLASYLAYVVTAIDDGGSTPSGPALKVGDWCPDCTPDGKPLFPSHPGMVGDGSVFEKCGRCGGTQKIQPDDPELGSAGCIGCCECCEVQPSLEELWDIAEKYGDFDPETDVLNQSQIRRAGEILEEAIRNAHERNDALEELEDQEEKKDPEPTPDILCFEGSVWTFENKRVREATNEDMMKHLIEVHGLDSSSVSKMNRDELIAVHNLLHNSEVRSSPSASSSKSSASCPSGSCPSGSCPSGSCPSNSSRSSSGSRSYRGFFGRRR